MKPSRSALAIAAVFVLSRSAAVKAQEAQDTTRLEELVVTPTRLPTSPDGVVSFDLLLAFSVILRDGGRRISLTSANPSLRSEPAPSAARG